VAKSLKTFVSSRLLAQNIDSWRLAGKVSGINEKGPSIFDGPFFSRSILIIAGCAGKSANFTDLFDLWNEWVRGFLFCLGLDKGSGLFSSLTASIDRFYG